MKKLITLLFALMLLYPAGAVWAQGETAAPPGPAARAAVEAGSIVGTAAYIPIKGLLCVFGIGTAPLLYVSSGPRAVRDVTNRTCKGTWIITTEVLKGEKPFDFVYDNPCCGYPEP